MEHRDPPVPKKTRPKCRVKGSVFGDTSVGYSNCNLQRLFATARTFTVSGKHSRF